MLEYAEELRSTVTLAARRLRELPADIARTPTRPGKWSPVQIIGHLIDSASNNHQRFVRAQFREDLRCDGYDQDAWVRVQAYAEASWLELLQLWEGFNLHIARVMDAAPESVRLAPRRDHNLDRLAFGTVPSDEPVTLDYFMRDYVAHLKHHLRQIDARLVEEVQQSIQRK